MFGLFDQLLLLGTGGYLVYFGPSSMAAAVLSSSPTANISSLNRDNPGDFIIDILGLGSDEVDPVGDREDASVDDTSDSTPPDGAEELDQPQQNHPSETRAQRDGALIEEEEQADVEISLSPMHQPSTPQSPSSAPPRGVARDDSSRHLRVIKLHQYFLSTPSYTDLLRELAPIVTAFEESLESHSFDRDESAQGIELSNLSAHSSHGLLSATRDDDPEDSEAILTRNSPSSSSDPRRPRKNKNLPRTSTNLPSVFRWDRDDQVNSTSIQERVRYPALSSTQMWVLFSRRVHAFMPSIQDSFYLFLQIVGVAIVVSVTFSYTIDNELEAPYQVIMLLSVIALYAMILQYLLLIPEYMTERPIITSECIAKYVNIFSYTVSTMLTEIPRAVIQVFLLLCILYYIHPLNPNPINRNFAFICLIVGVATFQSLITVCSMVTDKISVAYTVTFLILGSGTLFGGLLVRYAKIPTVFKFLYYVSIPAVTQRALISNDLQCCYMTVTCNSLAAEYGHGHHQNTSSSSSALSSVTSNFCPPGLGFTGDGSDDGNLGRVYLMVSPLPLSFSVASSFS